ncbi:MAG: exodeoxyribonuclease III [Bacteroidales bacterium]|nr:exodeoxyribonuclease III [Bacteroidales bacterium]
MKKILSYNVNGIRAAINKGFVDWLKSEKPDILCIQEIKANKEQFDVKIFEQLGYYNYWFSALKKGYSGVAILTKTEPDNIEYGISIKKYDDDGRVIRADFGEISLFNAYFPSGTTGGVRQEFKMDFLYDFQNYLKIFKQKRPKIIVSGDYNICHKPIDINHPERHKKSSGFLPEEREWFDGFINSGLTDSFREFNKEANQYSWWSYRANSRVKNLGWRIDYHLISNLLKSQLKSASILPDVFHSDHCPVMIEMDI